MSSNAFENQLNSDDELLPEYSFDYQKAKPNRFANRSEAKSLNYEILSIALILFGQMKTTLV